MAHSGKYLAVAVVAQVEHPRETGRGKARLLPEAVAALIALEIFDAARTAGSSTSPVAISPSSAQAVCDAVLGDFS